MSGTRVLVTVDRQKIREIDDVLARLKRDGLEVEQTNTVLGVTHIVGSYDGDIQRLNSEGVVAEREGWKSEI
jgi:hypothetical protein